MLTENEEKLVEHTMKQTMQAMVTSIYGLTLAQAKDFGLFEETALNKVEQDEIFDDFVNASIRHTTAKRGQ